MASALTKTLATRSWPSVSGGLPKTPKTSAQSAAQSVVQQTLPSYLLKKKQFRKREGAKSQSINAPSVLTSLKAHAASPEKASRTTTSLKDSRPSACEFDAFAHNPFDI